MAERAQRMLAMKPEGSIIASISVISEVEDKIKDFLERLEIEAGEWSDVSGPRVSATIKQVLIIIRTIIIDLMLIGLFVDHSFLSSWSHFN